eukprot:28422-Chlamydomonas_euryale.AAC.1
MLAAAPRSSHAGQQRATNRCRVRRTVLVSGPPSVAAATTRPPRTSRWCESGPLATAAADLGMRNTAPDGAAQGRSAARALPLVARFPNAIDMAADGTAAGARAGAGCGG